MRLIFAYQLTTKQQHNAKSKLGQLSKHSKAR